MGKSLTWTTAVGNYCRDYLDEDHYGDLLDRVAEIKYGYKPKGKKEMAKNDLYEVKVDGKSLFGTKLAVNSLGQWVMEIKGSGLVVAVDAADVTKVVPYTIGVSFVDGGTVYHYLADVSEGYKVGDFAIVAGYAGNAYQLARIVAVDTKSEAATKNFQPLKRL